MKKFNAKPSNGKVFRNGLYSTAILAEAIVLAILLNLLVRAIPSKYTEFDLSEGKMYTLTDTSVQLTQKLEQDVTIYYLCQTGDEDTIITKLLNNYAAQSSHIRWEQKDPALYPTFAAQYGEDNISTGSLIVVSGDSHVALDAADLYEYDYSDYYTTGSAKVTFSGEKQISAAIYKLTSSAETHAYYTTNHGEQALTDSLTEALNAQNITVDALDLLSSEIPEDCDLLIINNPTSDFAAEGSLVDEVSMLQNYLNEGGHLLVATNPYNETPELDSLLAEFGLSRENGIVVEGDSSHALYGYPYSLFPDYASTSETTALDGVNQNTRVMLSVAQGISITETDDVTAEALLNTSDEAYSKVNTASSTADKEDGDLDGPFTLAAWARSDTTGAEVIWIGCGNLDNEQLYQSVPGNRTFLQGCAASLAGQDSAVLIDTKTMEADPIAVPASASTALGMVFVFLLPAAVLATGAVVVLLRRRK